MKKTNNRVITYNSLFIILIIIVSFILGEIGTRIYLIASGNGGYIWLPDYYLAKAHAPNSSFLYWEDFSNEFLVRRRTNSLGLVGEEISAKKPQDTKRVLILGDSFTEALQVPEGKNFCEQLQTLLNEKNSSSNQRYEVINGGMAGYSPISEYLYLKRDLINLNPDIVILQLFPNDVFDDYKAKAVSVMDNEDMPIKLNSFFVADYFGREISQDDISRSESRYKIFKYFLGRSKFLQLVERARGRPLKKAPLHRHMTSLPEFNDQNQFFIIQAENRLFQSNDFKNRTYEDTKKYISAIRKLSEENKANFIMFLIPVEAQINLKSYGLNTRLYFPKHPNTYLNKLLYDFSRQEKIKFLDLLSLFERNKTKELYFKRDGHLTEQGHELVADALYNLLRKNYIIE